ncbi:MAG: hypothetical protein LLH30_16440 [Candidatus Manganitrophus sp. SA1]|nr:hypothetical protein [Candidatus Manganitrophus morganii]
MRDDLTKTSAIKGHYFYVGNLLLTLLGVFLLLPEKAEGVCNLIGSLTKPDSVTQTRCTQMRTTPTDRLAPGFDPSKLLTHSFPGEIGGTAAIDSALELFVVLGPGEITGNPFGQLLDKTSTICSEMGGPIGHECQGLNNISLGRAKFNTATQRDIPPSTGPCFDTGPNPDVEITESSSPSSFSNPPPFGQVDCPANDTAGYLHNNFVTQGDFFPFQLIHVGFDSIISFEAVPGGTTSPKTLVPCTAPAGWTCVNSSQTVEQVTGVFNDLGTGSFSAPGAGDQVVVNNVAAWSVQAKGDLKFTSPTIAWTQQITDPDFSGVALEGFDELTSGSFTYCQGSHAPGGPCEASNVPETSYTSGESQRNGTFSTLGGD